MLEDMHRQLISLGLLQERPESSNSSPMCLAAFINLLIYLYIFNHDQFKATFSVVIALNSSWVLFRVSHAGLATTQSSG